MNFGELAVALAVSYYCCRLVLAYSPQRLQLLGGGGVYVYYIRLVRFGEQRNIIG